MRIRGGKPKFVGTDRDVRGWTMEELDEQARRLGALHTEQVKLLRAMGAEPPV